MLLGLIGLAGVARAQPVPALTNVPPVYLKQGESRELALGGKNLSGLSGVAVHDARGIVASVVKPEKGPQPDATARLTLSAPADAPLGVRELRLVTPTGVTAPVAVTVGQYPFVADAGGEKGAAANDAPEQAQAVALPAAIGGRIEAAGDADCYRFDARKGERLIFDVHAARLGSPLEPVVTIHDAATGRELPHADAHHGGDPMAVFDVPADGAYVVAVRDLQYRGGGDYGYRIDAGAIPYVESLVPMTARRGQRVTVTAIGHNLSGAEQVTLDLTAAEPGPLPVRVKTSAGWSNELPLTVTDVPEAAEAEPNDAADKAAAVPLPGEVSGVLQVAGDEDFYRFTVPAKQTVTLEVRARRTGSPVDALLTLADAKGNVMDRTNGTPEAEARISRPMEPGEYVAGVRDLTYAGGPSYAYRLAVVGGALPPDFAVRFLPDAPRVARGGSARVWCEVVRLNGYKGDVTVAVEGLPAGVATSGPVVLEEKTSGLFTLTAAPDAALGSVPITLRATGRVGGQEVTRVGEAELGSRTVRQAYLTVTEPAPFTVDAVALIKPEQLKDYGKQVAELYNRLNAPSPQLDAAQAAWEKSLGSPVNWQVLQPEKLASAANVPLAAQPDGAVLAGGNAVDKDTYTVTATTAAKGITAIRLEVLPDPSLPAGGPGRAPQNGNFVLTKFAVTAAPKSDPAKVKPVEVRSARATFEQPQYEVAGLIDDKPEGGWAINLATGKPQSATFALKSPIKGDGGTVLTFTLDQQFGMLHTLGKFRLAVSTDTAAVQGGAESAPGPVAVILKVPADKRSAEQKAQLSAYYRSVAPELAADRARLEALRAGVGPYAEVARLEAILAANTTELDNERKAWEQTALTGGWSVPDAGGLTSAAGSLLAREPDGSISATGPVPATDTYTVTLTTPLRQVTAVRIEALPDERFPGGGPGRSSSGNFILSRVQMTAAARGADGKVAGKSEPVEFRTASATYEQPGWQAVGALDDRPETGWGVAPQLGRPASAAFVAKAPAAGGDGGTVLTLTLEQQSTQPQHVLGRFRVWVTGSTSPDAPRVPADVAAILRTAADKRSDEQKAALAAYFRTIAPSLAPVRERLAELKAQATPVPLVVARSRSVNLPVPVQRAAGFTGDVQVTLEGFSTGRDPKDRTPTPITKNLKVTPVTLKGDDALAKLPFATNGNCELGTRMVVLKAEAKIGNDTYVQYSPAFPLTVVEK